MSDSKLTIIGPGVMAEAIIAGLIRQELEKPENIILAGPRIERLQEMASRYGVSYMLNNGEAIQPARVVILAVKPQKLDRVLKGLAGHVNPEALVISIVAGAPLEKIKQGLNHESIVRSMPNTPAQIGEGITVWTMTSAVSEDQKETARCILSALGEEIFVEEESYLDMATALSGTGPAYVFLFMEAMVDAGVHLGFPRRIAEQLVAKTVRGSVDYYSRRSDPVHLARLRNEVTSPGGTSAAALYYLEKAGFRTALSRAIWAAYERSCELGGDGISRAPDKNSS